MLNAMHRPATRLCCRVRRFFPSCWRRLRVVEEAAGRGLVESRQNVALCNHRAESRTDGRYATWPQFPRRHASGDGGLPFLRVLHSSEPRSLARSCHCVAGVCHGRPFRGIFQRRTKRPKRAEDITANDVACALKCPALAPPSKPDQKLGRPPQYARTRQLGVRGNFLRKDNPSHRVGRVHVCLDPSHVAQELAHSSVRALAVLRDESTPSLVAEWATRAAPADLCPKADIRRDQALARSKRLRRRHHS